MKLKKSLLFISLICLLNLFLPGNIFAENIEIPKKNDIKPKVSIVIPIYNVEKYIRACLDSAVNQTLKEIEIICVDDGTPDSSGKIADEYAQKDSRVKVIHQENHGLPAARNRGMEEVKGEYIKFLDSDDTLELQACEICYDKAKLHNADILVHDAGNKILTYPEFKPLKNEKIIIGPRFELIKYSSCTGIYKTDFVKNNHIKCNENASYGEDQVFNMMCNPLANKIVCIPDKFYNYTIDNINSITHTPNDKIRKSKDHIEDVRFIYEYWKEKGWFSNKEAKIGFLKWVCYLNYWKKDPEICKKFIKVIGPELLTKKNINMLPKKHKRIINNMLKFK